MAKVGVDVKVTVRDDGLVLLLHQRSLAPAVDPVDAQFFFYLEGMSSWLKKMKNLESQ